MLIFILKTHISLKEIPAFLKKNGIRVLSNKIIIIITRSAYVLRGREGIVAQTLHVKIKKFYFMCLHAVWFTVTASYSRVPGFNSQKYLRFFGPLYLVIKRFKGHRRLS